MNVNGFILFSSVGYCQGMSFVCAWLLMVMPEEVCTVYQRTLNYSADCILDLAEMIIGNFLGFPHFNEQTPRFLHTHHGWY